MEHNNLHVKNLSKRFATKQGDLQVLDDISFSAEAGKVVAILGKSGSGKTTLLDIISRLEKPDTGQVEYAGTVSYTPQKDLLLPWRTAKSNTLLPSEIQHVRSESIEKIADSMLSKFGLIDFKDTYPQALSGGMRQKVSLVRSLIQDSAIYLFDEALSAIDFDSRLKLATEIRSYIQDKKKIGVFVTHNIEEAISISDKIIVLSSKPAKVIYETDVKISDDLRDPVAIRKNPEFQKYFETLWHIMAES